VAFETLATDDPTLRGWALASGLAPGSLLPDGAKPVGPGAALVYLPGLLHPAAQQDWDAWLDALARYDHEIDVHVAHAFTHGFRDATLVLAGREAVRWVVVRTSDRLCFWRRNRIAELLAEVEPT
jgi:hypothetical protein